MHDPHRRMFPRMQMSVCLSLQLLPGSHWCLKVGWLWSLSFTYVGVHIHMDAHLHVSKVFSESLLKFMGSSGRE